MCLVPRRPPKKITFVWRLLAFAPPFLRYIYIYLIFRIGVATAKVRAEATPEGWQAGLNESKLEVQNKDH